MNAQQNAADERFHLCPAGRHWGPGGAAGILPYAVARDGQPRFSIDLMTELGPGRPAVLTAIGWSYPHRDTAQEDTASACQCPPRILDSLPSCRLASSGATATASHTIPAMPPVCIYVLLNLPECQASIYAAKTAKHAGSWISASVLTGWITAIATGLLALFAIVTAYYARKAFLKQSQEVTDQAEMLRVQSEQLAEQRKVNAEQIKVLKLQAAELRESIDERKYAQASRVYIDTKVGPDPRISQAQRTAGTPAPETVTAHVKNDSDQPIYYAELVWNDDTLGPNEMVVWPGAERLARVILPGGEVTRTKDPVDTPDARDAVLTFRDAAGIHWLRAPDGYLMDFRRYSKAEEEWARSFRRIVDRRPPDGAGLPEPRAREAGDGPAGEQPGGPQER
jgi:hypothetical protein